MRTIAPLSRLSSLLSALLLSALCAACAAPGGVQASDQASAAPSRGAAPAQAGAAQPSDTLARIHALVGTPSCTESSQCRSLAIGERPCGGPEGYLAYSTVNAPEAELRALGAIYQAERRQAHAAAGRVSDCGFMPDPGALCRAGACVPGAGTPVAR